MSHLQLNSWTQGSENIIQERMGGEQEPEDHEIFCEIANSWKWQEIFIQPHRCPKKTQTAPIDMLPWKSKISWAGNPRPEATDK